MAASATPRNAESTRCVAVAFSGGRDSTALLHATLAAAAKLGLGVVALHVHHGLVAGADAWVRTLTRRCAAWRKAGAPLEFRWSRLESAPAAGESIEAWARRARYKALARMAREAGASLVLLGHHRRDQAETFLLQALRGGGAAGLSAMPRLAVREGLSWARPWVDEPREAVEAYVRHHRLRFIDDESNADPRFARNRLRAGLWPVLQRDFPGAEASLCAAARRAQQEAECLRELAEADLAKLVDDGALSLPGWLALSEARRANSLRAWLKLRAGRGAAETLVQRLLAELPQASSPARWPAGSDGAVLRRYRGRLDWQPAVPSLVSSLPLKLPITAPGIYEIDGLGRLHVEPAEESGEGVELALLAKAELRPRAGSEQFQRAAGSVPRSLKKQFQAAGLPEWERKAPLLFCEGRLVFVPGLGIDARALARKARSQVTPVKLRWEGP